MQILSISADIIFTKLTRLNLTPTSDGDHVRTSECR